MSSRDGPGPSESRANRTASGEANHRMMWALSSQNGRRLLYVIESGGRRAWEAGSGGES